MDAAVAAAAAAAHPRSPAAQQVSLVGEPAVQLAYKKLRVLLCHKNCPSQHPGGIRLVRQWATELAWHLAVYIFNVALRFPDVTTGSSSVVLLAWQHICCLVVW